ncbi:MAG: hypothetical protein B7X46_14055 [Thiomonas sp. 15-66-11]|jgi:DNA segregation ATPase FtsK/SpoIIIE-like protein|nr:MAG: hypothetical protein B7X46_14055 [Thiomonas sp. 15-66-11]
MELSVPETNLANAADDKLYEQAKALVLKQNNASVALIQCHLRLGYSAACKLFERMQGQGIVKPVPGVGRQWTLAKQGDMDE